MTTTGKFDFDFNSITGDKDVDQARALRLVLAVLDNEMARVASVAEEVATDYRGPEIAIWELVIGMAGSVAMQWEERVGAESTVEAIRATLNDYAAKGESR